MNAITPSAAEIPTVVEGIEEVVESLVVMIETVTGVLDHRLRGLETALGIAGDVPGDDVRAALAALDSNSTGGCVTDLCRAGDLLTHLRGRLESIGLRVHPCRNGDELEALASELDRAADDPPAVRALAARLRGIAWC